MLEHNYITLYMTKKSEKAGSENVLKTAGIALLSRNAASTTSTSLLLCMTFTRSIRRKIFASNKM